MSWQAFIRSYTRNARGACPIYCDYANKPNERSTRTPKQSTSVVPSSYLVPGSFRVVSAAEPPSDSNEFGFRFQRFVSTNRWLYRSSWCAEENIFPIFLYHDDPGSVFQVHREQPTKLLHTRRTTAGEFFTVVYREASTHHVEHVF